MEWSLLEASSRVVRKFKLTLELPREESLEDETQQQPSPLLNVAAGGTPSTPCNTELPI